LVTECSFEGPAQLKKRHPALYDELKGFYHQDPEPILRDDPRS
jgi:MtfA peptidase